ncbi:tetratricopeptide repeat protein 28-like [Stylophora pistillata]|nr:tetratricopeptide repeat protein 28-like [Stylophora pistillata]
MLLPAERCEDRYLVLDDETGSPTNSEEIQQPQESSNTYQLKDKNEGGTKDEAPLKVLYKVIIAPVADPLEGSEIVVVPDRSLYRVPFSALMNEQGEFLAEKFRIRYTPSLTTLKLIQDSPADYHSETGVPLVGDPDVGTVMFQGSELTLPQLPKAKGEVEMIGNILNVQPLTGKEATKEAVLQKIHSVSLIHIAAHGEAERGNIALAPSNREKDDFLLTMADISAVRLRAKLVVLSCCHSGKGHIKAEGVVGIARAFLGSGARSVLASLWAVDDEATMDFMKQFYEHLVDGKSASECLHETMKWMRKKPKYSEVKDWAPFVLIGDDVSFKFV